MPEDKIELDGIHATLWLDDGADDPITLPACDRCALFRRRRRGKIEGRCCGNGCKSLEWLPSSRDLTHFDSYRQRIRDSLYGGRRFFVSWFYSALWVYPELRYDDFRIRVSIAIEQAEAKVVEVMLEGPSDGIREYMEAHIVFAFKACSKNAEVCFEFSTSWLLSRDRLFQMRRNRALGIGREPQDIGTSNPESREDPGEVAYGIADVFSDLEPEAPVAWKLSDDIRRKISGLRPNRPPPVHRAS